MLKLMMYIGVAISRKLTEDKNKKNLKHKNIKEFIWFGQCDYIGQGDSFPQKMQSFIIQIHAYIHPNPRKVALVKLIYF